MRGKRSRLAILGAMLATAVCSTTAPAGAPAGVEGGAAPDSMRWRPRLDRTDAFVTLGLGAAAVAASEIHGDERLAAYFDKNTAEGPFDVGRFYGNGVVEIAATAGCLAVGELAGNARLRDTGLDLARALAGAAAVTWTLKLAVDEDRPNGGENSFPSGHTSTAFAVAPVFYRRFGPAVGIPAYALATLTGLGRVEDHEHHLQDVIFGAAIGIVAGRVGSSEGRFAWRLAPGRVGVSVGF